MTRIRLWSPQAKKAFIWILSPDFSCTGRLDAPLAPDQIDAKRHEMAREDSEHFSFDAEPGTNYLLSIDDHLPLPDPCSARQPWGVHGPSQVYDPACYRFRHPNPDRAVLGGLIYEIHIGTFTPAGTFNAAIDRLDYVRELGVGTVEVMPINPFPGDRGWGYDAVSWFAIHEPYGGPAGFQAFVDACHQRDLNVCVDVVYNHFGPAGNYAPPFAPVFTTKYTTPWGAAINLDDDGSPQMRRLIIDNACRWFSAFNVDALRLDAVHALIDHSERHILAELSDEVAALGTVLGRKLTLIAESDLNQVAMVTPTAQDGLGIDGQWSDDFHHALHSYLSGETFGYYVDFGAPQTLSKAIEKVFVHNGCYSTFRGRDWGSSVPDSVDRRRFVVFTQNHDQVGNRGMGDRPEASLDDGLIAAGAALTILSPFSPMLFQGQEWGTRTPFQFFTDHDPQLGAQVSEGRLHEFDGHGWEEIYGASPAIPDPQARSTFINSGLDWSQLDDEHHQRLWHWYRTLIDLRAKRDSNLPVTTDFGSGWFAMTCGALTTVVCTGRDPIVLSCDGTLVASWGEDVHVDDRLYLPAHSVAIVKDGSVQATTPAQ